MFGFDVFVVVPNLGKVFVVIARRIEDPFDATVFPLVVDETHDDRNMGTFGDYIEAFLPMFHRLPRPFGADEEMGVLGFAEHVDHLLHEMVLVAAVDGDAAQFLQNPADDGLEELLFDHHLELDAVVPIESKADEEVFDGGVGRNDANRIAQISWSFVDSRPTAKTKPQFRYLFL